jgi:hypothetical protein
MWRHVPVPLDVLVVCVACVCAGIGGRYGHKTLVQFGRREGMRSRAREDGWMDARSKAASFQGASPPARRPRKAGTLVLGTSLHTQAAKAPILH